MTTVRIAASRGDERHRFPGERVEKQLEGVRQFFVTVGFRADDDGLHLGDR